MNSSTPSEQRGLYTPQYERDSCGVGLMVNLKNRPSHYVVDSALTILENMVHRGASGCEENTGDGAGMLLQIPHDFFKTIFAKTAKQLPAQGTYGIGMFFLPKDKAKKDWCMKLVREQSWEAGFELALERTVPTNNAMIGETALNSEPDIVQLFFESNQDDIYNLESRFYLLRNIITKKIYQQAPELVDTFYICSLSSKTIVYKGLLTAEQLRGYYPDFQEETFCSAIAMVHSRFSTNTFPKWKLAQPFRCIAHNGEINTLPGNINWWKARENNMVYTGSISDEIAAAFPVCDDAISDSGNFDNVVNFLNHTGKSLPQAMMMMIPEAWQNDVAMAPYKKAFYKYHDAIMEPWDGPASICFSDGTIAGATLDRNGLRPSRYMVTKDDFLILGSEAGCLDIAADNIVKKGRLEPGKILLADLSQQCIVSDEKIKSIICEEHPYGKWLEENALHIIELPEKETRLEKSLLDFRKRQLAFGFTLEDEKLIVNAMLKNGKEPIGSMGADIPLAVFSKIAQHPANYFKQQFAEVTNPPIDSLREKFFMTLSTAIGAGSGIVNVGAKEARTIRFDSPVLKEKDLRKILYSNLPGFKVASIPITYDFDNTLKEAIDDICNQAISLIEEGVRIIRLTDRLIHENKVNVPSLLITGALHHRLIEKGLRKDVGIIIDAGDVWETHHFACLLSFGADLICPHIALEACKKLSKSHSYTSTEAIEKYRKAVNTGLLKIMSKLGVSTLASYKGAQTFEALGISKEVIDLCFKGTVSRIDGMTFEDLERENRAKHNLAFFSDNKKLVDVGAYQWKRRGEYHLFNPSSIHLLQFSTKTNNYDIYKKFATEIDKLENNASTLRSFLKIKNTDKSIPIAEVEPVENILKRFATGAMSFGSISHEAHTTLAKAMNRIGGKSNSGEGGEDERRFRVLKNGDSEKSAIKQVASGRFGVTINYLTNAEELQIKMAQGAKPGEGGQLPGHKVDENIARVRHATPGVGLISPPPHHDIYSIEDLAQLIYDLKNANRKARISVKLVAKAGVGIIASGVTKAHADHILISGSDGGTGASPLSSIRHAGLPWELGLSETHQTLVLNGLRDRVVLQTDGQIRTGRDLAVACMLGAEEWGIATAALVVEGCILMRKCHLNTCPVGIATQDKDLRKKFDGKVEHLVNYFHFLAEHLREIMAELGIRTVNELVGRTDLLEINGLDKHWKTKNVDLAPILFQQENKYENTMFASKEQNHDLENVLDRTLIALSKKARKKRETYSDTLAIKNTNRAVGTMLSNEIAKQYGSQGMPKDSLNFSFEGSAGQSFGAFAAKGLSFTLEGEANDYFGKGLSGGKLVVKPQKAASFDPNRNIIVGNVALYGATSGEAYINGHAGDRFCVRNSGAHAVVESIGDNGCEYMTGGIAVILGKIGRNFGAGMSGGLAFLYKQSKANLSSINKAMVLLETPNEDDLSLIRLLIQDHYKYTGSKIASKILDNWNNSIQHFTKVIPQEYKRAMLERKSLRTAHG